MGDHVHVDGSRQRGDFHPDTARQQLRETSSPRHTQHELVALTPRANSSNAFGHIVAHDVMKRAAQALDKRPVPGEIGRAGVGQAIVAGDVDGQQVSALGPVGNPRSAPDQRLALGAAGQSHDYTLPRFPRPCDVVAGAVAVELVVHLVRQPQHCQLAQRGEVPDPEVVAQCGIHLFRG